MDFKWKDKYGGISKIEYNSLNLPRELLVKNTNNVGKVYYNYSASGAKLRVTHLSASDLNVTPVLGISGDASYNRTKITDYVGNKIYENGSLKRILVDGGYIENNAYHYYLADHLGNNRIVAKADASIVQSTHYYPFGMAFADGVGQAAQPYKFSGKELDTELGLNIYDSQARQLTSGLPRFTSVDPMAEMYYNWSPYVYCANNPIKFIDPTGKYIVGTDGKKVTYSRANGLSSNVEQGSSVGQYVNSMNMTQEGQGQLQEILNASFPVEIVVQANDIDPNRSRLGAAANEYNTTTNEIKKSTIYLFTENIKAEVADLKAAGESIKKGGKPIASTPEKMKLLLDAQPTVAERTAQAAVHESTHVTKNGAQSQRVGTTNAEKVADQHETTAIKQTVASRKIENEIRPLVGRNNK